MSVGHAPTNAATCAMGPPPHGLCARGAPVPSSRSPRSYVATPPRSSGQGESGVCAPRKPFFKASPIFLPTIGRNGQSHKKRHCAPRNRFFRHPRCLKKNAECLYRLERSEMNPRLRFVPKRIARQTLNYSVFFQDPSSKKVTPIVANLRLHSVQML